MNVKSETSENKFMKFFEDFLAAKTYALLIGVSALVIFSVLGFTIEYWIYVDKLDTKYNKLVTTNPIIKCGNEQEVKPSNYKVVLVDETPVVRVFYSDTKVVSYDIKECYVITEVLNAELGVENVQFVNTELKSKNEALQIQINSVKKAHSKIVAKNKKIKKDYKLPTQKQLDTYYTKFKKDKRKDFDKYLSQLQQKEKEQLALARAEKLITTPNSNDDCYDESFEGDDELYTLWMAGKCDEINWRLANKGKKK